MARVCLPHIWVLILAFFLAVPVYADKTPDNPRPADGDVIIPLPDNRQMVFRPVFLGLGGAPFAQRSFRMGDPDGGFKEHPTGVSLSGSFLGEGKFGKDWLYYMAKYEVNQGQWAAVNGLPAPDRKTADTPITNITWFEAQQFLDKLNQWLFANALDKLPTSGGSKGFVRLPLEAEWEFAARGGAQVSADVFDRRTPYQQRLSSCEWFAGPKSSHGKLKAVGRLNPNPLGLYDMLGNVAEMTWGLYMIEYYQGRPGGFVARGGHYLSSEKRLRSSLRTEEPFYIARGSAPPTPNKKATLGMRPVLAAVVFGDRNTAQTYAEAWDIYRNGTGADTPAAVSTAPTSQKTRVSIDQAGQYLARLEEMAADNPGMQQELGRLKSVMADVQFIQAKADGETAYAWFKIAAERGFFVYLESKKLPMVHKLIEAAKAGKREAMIEKLTTRRAEIEANIRQSMENYSISLRQLETLDQEARQTGETRYLQFLLENNAAQQVRAAKLVAAHLQTLVKTKRTAIEDWLNELSTLGL
ncbi:Formylglycine-generating enzyme, required for sulfatase activity, contains SUMF1/FGE domain [Desulfocicer vacuolatum DSM 3385]|uniref:Formylglycine-generating enzyme, required for sulfatase activity, contains SUMF1/FGE domain n=1 Tax=Desulfocicer vacuolatum DSM 3385 TaxID=1121400 RepID=A0A1W2DXR8_9BACT|nr:SUMF1/EgtB/PvdO family nonheme iron enzyme [Desulfocicer vacuolatum]SMD02291.1 Formylglycine-generating enzyme, required for sulfatase activity, contains SUMF1/FGE domain [Desulfocicer vacuolatum DSM 3385]